MKPSPTSNPHSPFGRYFGMSPSAYTMSQTSQTSFRPGTSEVPRYSPSEASLYDFKEQINLKKQLPNLRSTTEADSNDEETPGMARRRAMTKVVNKTPSSFKTLKSYKSVVLNVPDIPKEGKPGTLETLSRSNSKKKVIVSVEGRTSLLSSPFNLEKMFPRKISLARNRKRRKSCHCEWCGGMSALEKKLNRNPLLTRTPRRKKKKEEGNAIKEEDQASSRGVMSRTSLGGPKGRSKTSRSNSRGKSLFHSKTLGSQKLGSLIGSLKPLTPLERNRSIYKDEKANKSLEYVISAQEEGYQEDMPEISKNASLVVEQEEEEVQNASIEDLHESQFNKIQKVKKEVSSKVKLQIKMRKLSQASTKGAVSPHNLHSVSYKRGSICVSSPLKKPQKPEKLSIFANIGIPLTDKPQSKSPKSPKFTWDKFTNQVSDIMSVYNNKQMVSPHYSSLARTVTEQKAQTKKVDHIFSMYKGMSFLNKKQVSEPSVLIKSHRLGLSLSNHRSSMQESTDLGIGIGMRRDKISEALLSPVRLNTRGEARVKKVYSVVQSKVRAKC